MKHLTKVESDVVMFLVWRVVNGEEEKYRRKILGELEAGENPKDFILKTKLEAIGYRKQEKE
ncbi:MAG: hypothetical protein HZR80_00105 [Candidatus Heimdallarchaeota archaeon]